MSIFGNIASAIFGSSKGAPPASPSAAPSTASRQQAPSVATGKPMPRSEVEAMIEKIADEQDENYDWDKSIVDLMKLLKLDNSLAARKQLAQELGYKGKLDGSADMNVWLHEQVMTKLAESGGKVPEGLKRA